MVTCKLNQISAEEMTKRRKAGLGAKGIPSLFAVMSDGSIALLPPPELPKIKSIHIVMDINETMEECYGHPETED